MTDLRDLIECEIDQYLEWPTADKSHVTTTSAKLFAEHVAQLYADHFRDAGNMAAPAVRGELVGWQFYKHGKWWNGDILTKNQRKNIEKEGVRVRNVYAEPQPAEQQPAPDVSALVEALEAIQKAATHESIHTGIQEGTALGFIAAICNVTLAAHRRETSHDNQ